MNRGGLPRFTGVHGRALLCLALAVGARHSAGQDLVYVEPGVAACPAAPAPTAAVAKTVQRGAPVSGKIDVRCGFDQGSYTVTLNSSDPGATFKPKTFIVNFGRVIGRAAYTVAFSTLGVHGVSAAITSNMGSPVVRGRFAGSVYEFNVVLPFTADPTAAGSPTHSR